MLCGRFVGVLHGLAPLGLANSTSDMTTSEPSSVHTPIAIRRDGESAIVITFDDDKEVRWTAAELRKACPCATCREKKRGEEEKQQDTAPKAMLLPVLSAAEARPLTIGSMNPVGQYGYNIGFSDGHNSGIFLFDLLYR
jgi:DUF971 family protein